jgi:hypothetical protein
VIEVFRGNGVGFGVGRFNLGNECFSDLGEFARFIETTLAYVVIKMKLAVFTFKGVVCFER